MSSEKVHSTVESALVRPLPFLYTSSEEEVTSVIIPTTASNYDNLDISAYNRFAKKLGVPFFVVERADNDTEVNSKVFVEAFYPETHDSELHEGIPFADIKAGKIRGISSSDNVNYIGVADAPFADAFGAQKIGTPRFDFEGYAVIDFETTGFNPLKGDRALEIAVAQTDVYGNLQSEWTTLFNPEREDTGAEWLHHISSSMVKKAPLFSDVAPLLGNLLANRKVVAHNAKFDYAFLAYEFQASGLEVPILKDDMVCTMEWAKRYADSIQKFTLAMCCEREGIEITNAHAAAGDVEATVKLVKKYLGKYTDDFTKPLAPSSDSLAFADTEGLASLFVGR